MKVLKFGGTSVGSVENIRKVSKIVSDSLKENSKLYVVCSAMSGVTDHLIKMSELAALGDSSYLEHLDTFREKHINTANQLVQGPYADELVASLNFKFKDLESILEGIYLLKEASSRSMDYVLSFGERSSNLIISYYLKQEQILAEYLDARKVVKTDSQFGSANVDFQTTNLQIQAFDTDCAANVVLVTGFIASDQSGVTTTLGRGGSDYTASIFAAALQADGLEIWTDVDGVLNANPQKVSSAYTIPYLHYLEAMEMSHFGAKVIYPPTIQPAFAKKIPIQIKNTFNPTSLGTKIGNDERRSKSAIKGISSINDIAMINLEGSALHGAPGSASRLFSCLAKQGVNIIMITQASSEQSISIAVSEKSASESLKAIRSEFSSEIEDGFILDPISEHGLSIVAMVGLGMKNMQGVAGKLFGALGKNGVNIKAIAQGSSELNISFVISGKDEVKALNLVHESFFLSEYKRTNIFLVGVGLIGGTLIDQIKENQERLKRTKSLNIQIAGICRSTKMILNEEGIDLNNWKEQLQEGESIHSVSEYIDRVIGMNPRNAVLVDCTASVDVPELYEKVLNANISISTPNKVACSSPFANYQKLKSIADTRNIYLKYETNVGAGLPIISTIQGLLDSGDEIINIEGVLSGSCSYIFNQFNGSRSFHDIVLEAKEKGLTEPDPRDDLSGKDIQRKITILAREAGFQIETDDVSLENVLPNESLEAKSVEDFMKTLMEQNAFFEEKLNKARTADRKLRYIAKYEKGNASVSLQEVDQFNPFYNLQGSDNMVVLTTDRYRQRPLVVSGPGAGAEVTSAGIFSEIISMF